MKFTVEHDIDCSAERFWDLMVSTDFSRQVFASIGISDWEADQKDTGDVIVRNVKGRMKTDMPGPLAKFFGPSFRYTEVTRLDRVKRECHVVVTSSVMSDRIKNEQIIRVEPQGSDRCRRVTEVIHEVKVLGVGGLMERSMERITRASIDKAVDFINRWIKDHAETSQRVGPS
jgi:hypothetical protein